jgi:transposase
MSWIKGGQPWMTAPYSQDLRERIVRVVDAGTSRNAAAKQFDVSISFVVKLLQRWRQRGTIKADKYGGWKKPKLAPHAARIRALVAETCDITIDELCAVLAAEGIEAKRSTLGDFLLAQGLSRKKRPPTPPSRSAQTSRRRAPPGATRSPG